MSKKDIKDVDDKLAAFSRHKSYSIDEVLAAGGPDAFAEKLGKNFQNLQEKLSKLPADAFLTDEEVEEALKTLNESK